MVSPSKEVDKMDPQRKYTLLELIDVAIRDGFEVVNFRILQEIIKTLIKATGLADVKIPYDEKDEQPVEKRPQAHKVYEESEENIEDKWLKLKLDRRMQAFEIDLEEKSQMIDALTDITNSLKRDFSKEKDFNKLRDSRLEKLIVLTNEMKVEHDGMMSDIEVIQLDLKENVAYKYELTELKEEIEGNVDIRIKELKKLILEIESSSATKEELMELLARTENLEDEKVSREELGALLDPSFLEGIRDLEREVQELKEMVNTMDTRLDELKYATEKENQAIKQSIDDIHSQLQEIKNKLDQLDPEDINNALADLEDANEALRNDFENLKTQFDNLQREAKNVFKQIAGFSDDINRLQKLKMDKSECYSLLKAKADLSLVMEKLDKREFDSVMDIVKDNLGVITEDLKRLTIRVQIDEEETAESFENVRAELSLQMYKEDFIICTEPIRNRIKALMFELKELKKIVRDRLDPDIPGTRKCICINSIAHMPMTKSSGDCRCRSKTVKASPPETTEDSPTDLDGIPFPSADYPRERNPRMVPVLLAKAQPNIGLQHEKRKFVIKQELADYFSKKPTHAIDGAHTLTAPQQRGTSFNTAKVPLPRKKNVLLQGTDKGIYRGSVTTGFRLVESQENFQSKRASEESRVLLPPITSAPSNSLPSQKPVTRKKISFPSLENDKETSRKK